MRRRDESGAMAIEFVMVVPAVLVIFALIFAFGRAAGINGNLESGTRDAARSVTQARSYDEAIVRANDVVEEAMSRSPQACQNTLTVRVQDRYNPGEPVTVWAECTYDLSDLGLPGAPGDVTARSSFTSMLDPYRGVNR